MAEEAGASAEPDTGAAIRAAFPKAWLCVSDAGGTHVSHRNAVKYMVLTFGAKAAARAVTTADVAALSKEEQRAAVAKASTDDVATGLLQLLQHRQASKATKRWSILRRALRPSLPAPTVGAGGAGAASGAVGGGSGAGDDSSDGGGTTGGVGVEAAADGSVRQHPGLRMFDVHTKPVSLHGWATPTWLPTSSTAEATDAVVAHAAARHTINCVLHVQCSDAVAGLVSALQPRLPWPAALQPVSSSVVRVWRTDPPSPPAAIDDVTLAVDEYTVSADLPPAKASVPPLVVLRPVSRLALADLVSHRDDAGVDNTGNVCVWPAEQVAAWYCLRRAGDLAGATVVEVGSGMAGFAGMVVAAACGAGTVVITDGNATAARNLSRCLAVNRHAVVGGGDKPTCVASCGFVWGTAPAVFPADSWWCAACGGGAAACGHPRDLTGRVDVIVGADCLFFDAYHDHLLHTCARLLRPPGTGDGGGRGGQAWFLAPRRGGSLGLFVRRAAAFDVRAFEGGGDGAPPAALSVTVADEYDDAVTRRRAAAVAGGPVAGAAFSDDLHYPVLVVVERV